MIEHSRDIYHIMAIFPVAIKMAPIETRLNT